ncbi:MAG: hypothetical protein HYZ38_15005 [Mycobacterium sp.]|nr:hypothetical protein [Mycobacterium sp.]
MDTAVRVANAARRLAIGIILVTCAGGGAFVLVSRPHTDCDIVAEMMDTYSGFQTESSAVLVAAAPEKDNLLAVSEAEARTGRTLHEQAHAIAGPVLRRAAMTFADGVSQSADEQRADALQPPELDPFEAALPELDAHHLQAADSFFGAAHVLLAACPTVPRPVGLS